MQSIKTHVVHHDILLSLDVDGVAWDIIREIMGGREWY
jgi:hypothetical protein